MVSHDLPSAQYQEAYDMSRLHNENMQDFPSTSNPAMQHSINNIHGFSADQIDSLNSPEYTFTDTQSQQYHDNSNTLFYPQNTVTNSSFLQQPDTSPFSSQSIIQGSYSPSTVQDHISPDPYTNDYSSPSQFDANHLEQSFANAQIHSPLPMSDDGQTNFLSPDFPSNGTSNTEVNHNNGSGYFTNSSTSGMNLSGISPQPSAHLRSPSLYSVEQRPSPLSLSVPLFGNTMYGDVQNTSSANGSSIDLTEPLPHMRSPVVRIENCPDIPNQDNISRSLSRLSNAHLSPTRYENDESSEEEFPNLQNESSISYAATRKADGGWFQNAERGTGGLSPVDRSALNNQDILTLDEQAELRKRSEHNARVENWLTQSTNVSEDEDGQHRPQRQKSKRRNRPRARSTNDIAAMQNLHSQPENYGGYLAVPQPGPGVVVNETSEFGDEEDIVSIYSDISSEPSSPVADVPTRIAEHAVASRSVEDENLKTPTVPQRQPWIDVDSPYSSNIALPYQTANAALMAFYARTKAFDEVSLATTLDTTGSRRRSMSELGSLWSQKGISRKITSSDIDGPSKEKKGISGLFSNMTGRIPSRSNSKKRKSNPNSDNATSMGASTVQPNSQSGQRRMSSLINRPRTPKLNTDLPIVGMESRSPIAAVKSATISRLRNRSKSDSGRNKNLGIADLWGQHGGPPVGSLATPAQPFGESQVSSPNVRRTGNDSDDEDEDHPSMDLSVRTDMNVIPTYHGFQRQIEILNPHIDNRILDRLVKEQVSRYQRLIDARKDHQKNANEAKCASRHLCAAHGGQAEPITVRPGAKGPRNLPVFQIVPPGTPLENSELLGDAQAATFRQGVPQPPVKTLPARFECPYCFQAKDFKKPSDWTKHIHEDVQPFTCTFPECTDAKSFKRKADWVRHESERHRHLEMWTCMFEECPHVCYRRDNFVQHLVREHKIPEPKIRTGRHGGARAPAWSPNTPIDFGYANGPKYFTSDEEVNNFVHDYVESCRSDSDKEPSSEPCRFCGNICKSWKQLTVHLAKHMEQIAMPIIPLVEQHPAARDASRSFIQHQMRQMPSGIMTGHPSIPVNIPSGPFIYDEPSEMENTPSIAISGPPIQYTFPPTNFGSGQMLDVDTAYAANMGTSYPPAMITSRSRGSSFNEGYAPQRMDTTYPPLNMMSNGYTVDQNPGMILLNMDHNNQQGQYGQSNQPNQQQFFTTMGHFNGT
jgi:hypothetical protein